VAYLFTTSEQQQAMLRDVGAASVDELFDQIPPEVRLDRPLQLPPPLTELELEAEVDRQARRNASADRVCFMGGGAYDHFIPAAVDEIASRGEFYTAYTPYQPEASQGSLQAFFEYQTLICQLTGMDVANASLYEGGTAVSEAAFMAMRVTERHTKIVVLGSVNPDYRQILATYAGNLECEVVTVPTPAGTADLDRVADAIDDRTACVVFQHPNYYGCLEDPGALVALAHQKDALAVVSFDPISLGLLQRPGQYGADITVAEGQSLGTPLQYGGPYLGVMACRNEFVRKMPGRLVTEARDKQGRRCYVLGLQTREQHIRREKATSNICTNQGLLALRATAYLSLLGPRGLREVAEICCRKAHYAAEQLQQVGLELPFERPFFKEFVLSDSGGSGGLLQPHAAKAGFEVGPALVDVHPSNSSTARGLLIAVTERRTRGQIDDLVAALRSTAESR
jgi:glycine dehydrogenase subunit 1